MEKKLSTEPYKGTRDFYPSDMAVQRYIFDTWANAAESFGFERYDASVLEPAELYKAKGAENEEIVNEQTYTFIDRGEREVTLRPEMTPTAARMVAGKRRELSFPVRWYSIPNLFRYERPQRGRLREHWQLNCDLFGEGDVAADVEVISLAYHTLRAFGATPDLFEIRVNDRAYLNEIFTASGLTDAESHAVLALLDRKDKIDNFDEELRKITDTAVSIPDTPPQESRITRVIGALGELGITNVRFSPSTVRGFSYYTGIIFEAFDISGENPRALLGGGRYDNLTELFGGEPITGVGFGMGDVTVHDFLETHNLFPNNIRVTAPTLSILPTEPAFNIEAEKLAAEFRANGIRTSVDLSDRKVGKKVSSAGEDGVAYIIVLGENEAGSGTYTLKKLATGKEHAGGVDQLTGLVIAD